MTTAQIVETSVTVNNCPIQGYDHLDDHASILLKTNYWLDSASAPGIPQYQNLIYV